MNHLCSQKNEIKFINHSKTLTHNSTKPLLLLLNRRMSCTFFLRPPPSPFPLSLLCPSPSSYYIIPNTAIKERSVPYRTTGTGTEEWIPRRESRCRGHQSSPNNNKIWIIWRILDSGSIHHRRLLLLFLFEVLLRNFVVIAFFVLNINVQMKLK